MKIFADTASLAEMTRLRPQVDGFTTNPTLIRHEGHPDYRAFILAALHASQGTPISVEVLADDRETMRRQAVQLSAISPHIYVKIPVCLTDGTSTAALVSDLVADGIPVNVTAIMTSTQVHEMAAATAASRTPSILSIFAGRIADTGVDPAPLIHDALATVAPQTEVLWASPREVWNLYQAEQLGCHIITVTPALLDKTHLYQKDLTLYARETVKMFYRDGLAAGFTL